VRTELDDIARARTGLVRDRRYLLEERLGRELVEKGVEVVLRVAGAVIVTIEVIEELGESGAVISPEVAGAVVGQDDPLGMLVGDVDHPYVDGLHPQLAGGEQQVVAREDLAGSLVDDQRAVLAVALEARPDGRHITSPGVTGKQVEIGSRYGPRADDAAPLLGSGCSGHLALHLRRREAYRGFGCARSRLEMAENSDISAAANAAYVDAFAARALTDVLSNSDAFYDAARELADTTDAKSYATRREQLAARYAPNGPHKREAIGVLLDRVVWALGMLDDPDATNAKQIALAALPGAATTTFYPSGELRPGDARRRPKSGSVHDARRALETGALLIARRGAGQCLNPACEAQAAGGHYCRRCEEKRIQEDHPARARLIAATWAGAVPHLVPHHSSAARRRRAQRSGQTELLHARVK